MDARSGGRHADRRHEPGRFLYPLPRQRGDARCRSPAYPVGGAGHHGEPAGAVALACRLQGCLRQVLARGEVAMTPSRLVIGTFVVATALVAGILASSADSARAIPAPAVDETPAPAASQTAVLAGGCFWGVQGVFQHVEGVSSAV